ILVEDRQTRAKARYDFRLATDSSDPGELRGGHFLADGRTLRVLFGNGAVLAVDTTLSGINPGQRSPRASGPVSVPFSGLVGFDGQRAVVRRDKGGARIWDLDRLLGCANEVRPQPDQDRSGSDSYWLALDRDDRVARVSRLPDFEGKTPGGTFNVVALF